MRELRIRLHRPEQTQEFISRVDQALSAGWRRDHTCEAELSPTSIALSIAYSCDEREARKAATIVLAVFEDLGVITTAQVVGVSKQQPFTRSLTHDEANVILGDFNETILRNVTTEIPASITVTADVKTIQDLMPAEAFLCLKQLSTNIDKSSLMRVEPSDMERWYDFLITISKGLHWVTSESLYRWLIEEEHWPEENAKWAASQFDSSVGLLRYYSSKGEC